MTTFTASCYRRGARVVDNGVGCCFFRWNSGSRLFGSQGDVVLLGKIPRKTTLLSFRLHVDPGSMSAGSGMAGLFYVTHSKTSTLTIRPAITYSAALVTLDNFAVWDHPRVSFTSANNHAAFVDVCFGVVGGSSATITTSTCLVGYITYITQPEL